MLYIFSINSIQGNNNRVPNLTYNITFPNFNLPVNRNIYLSIYLSISPSIDPPIHPSIEVTFCVEIFLPDKYRSLFSHALLLFEKNGLKISALLSLNRAVITCCV